MHTLLIVAVALLALLVLLLGFNVSLQRNKTKTSISPGTDPTSPLMKAVRAHANASEYVPLIIGLFITMGFVYQGRDLGIFATSLVVALVLARFTHAAGMLTCQTLEKSNPLRFIGALLTYVAGIVLCGLLLAKAF